MLEDFLNNKKKEQAIQRQKSALTTTPVSDQTVRNYMTLLGINPNLKNTKKVTDNQLFVDMPELMVGQLVLLLIREK